MAVVEAPGRMRRMLQVAPLLKAVVVLGRRMETVQPPYLTARVVEVEQRVATGERVVQRAAVRVATAPQPQEDLAQLIRAAAEAAPEQEEPGAAEAMAL